MEKKILNLVFEGFQNHLSTDMVLHEVIEALLSRVTDGLKPCSSLETVIADVFFSYFKF